MNPQVTLVFSGTTPAFRRFYRGLRRVMDRYEANIAASVAALTLGGATASARMGTTAAAARSDDPATLTICAS